MLMRNSQRNLGNGSVDLTRLCNHGHLCDAAQGRPRASGAIQWELLPWIRRHGSACFPCPLLCPVSKQRRSSTSQFAYPLLESSPKEAVDDLGGKSVSQVGGKVNHFAASYKDAFIGGKE